MGPGPPDPTRDFNIERYRDERTPEYAPYVKVTDLNNCVRRQTGHHESDGPQRIRRHHGQMLP